MRFRKKPVEIEAWPVNALLVQARHDFSKLPPQITKGYEGGNVIFNADTIEINTLEGTMTADLRDWVLCGVAGELYPCKPDIFEKSYEVIV